MGALELIRNIEESYERKNYKMSIKYLNEYFNMKNVGINDMLLNIYIDCQINLGMIEDAKKNTELMKKMFPDSYCNLIIKYIKFDKIDEAKELILTKKLSSEEYYYIAVTCFLWELYDEAKELFTHFLAISNDIAKIKLTNEYLRKISQYESNKNIFHETDYQHFKLNGKTLEPGHIVYAQKLLNIYNENVVNTDPKKDTRPYMIWKIIDDKIYAFPVSSKVGNQRSCLLKHEKYPNYTYDRKIKQNLVCIEECNVEKIKDKVTKEDYDNIIRDLYYSISITHDFPKQSTKFFIDNVTKQLGIKKHDVILVRDVNLNVNKFYFIIDIDVKKQKYKVVQVKFNANNNIELVNHKLENIKTSKPVLNVKRLDEVQKQNLINQIPDNYKGENLLGAIVEYDSRKLQIMEEQSDCYICLDKTIACSSSYVSIELIEKDSPLFVVGKIDRASYMQQLKNLKMNYHNEIAEKRKVFLRTK